MSSDVRADIQRLVDAFVTDLEALVRRAALETVAQALGAASPPAAAPAPRVPAGRLPEPARVRGRGAPPTSAPTRTRAAGRGEGGGERVRRSADQIEATAERIVRHVEQNPGQRSEDIRAALGLPKNEWQLTAKRLVDTGRLATKGEKRATVYFLKGESRSEPRSVGLGVVRRPGRGAPATPPPGGEAEPDDE